MTDEILMHYSADPLGRIGSRAQKKTADMKPAGFWVSVDSEEDNWPTWCRAEGFGTDRLRVSTRVFLRDDARILRIRDFIELDKFDAAFGVDVGGHGIARYIDWARVAKEHQGIIVSPYVFQRRSTFLWYYGWDCASGCIWDARAIADLVAVKPPSERAEVKA